MSTTLTVRTDDQLREKLEERARTQGKSISQLVREILRDAVEERPLRTRTGHLRGRLELQKSESEGWRKVLRERNWRS